LKDYNIDLGKTSLGIELGSTRIKVVLIDYDYTTVSSGEYGWESQYQNNIWTYSLDEVWSGVTCAYKRLVKDFEKKFNIQLTNIGSIGVSAMMHGYLVFDTEGKQLVPFRTWKNTTTKKAAEELTSLFKFNIPLRWSIAHLYQSILDEEEHVQNINFLTTLAGYVHWQLTGEKIIGIGDASGMFPIEPNTSDYNSKMIKLLNDDIKCKSYHWNLDEILPQVKKAGSNAGFLTKKGAKLLDPTGNLQPGVPFCPPEGDASTGMVSTNSIKPETGNVSAGTSIFAMVVLKKPMYNYYKEIDVVATPTGDSVAMIHCNNFTTDLNSWMGMFHELLQLFDVKVDKNQLFSTLFKQTRKADYDLGKLLNCNYEAGEPITGLQEGRPLFVRAPDGNLNIANFMKTQLYSSLATLKIGLDLLKDQEGVQVDNIAGQGGFFKTENIGQQILADSINVPVSTTVETGEGGPWGMALLANYLITKEKKQSLENFLERSVFSNIDSKKVNPDVRGVKTFNNFIKKYQSLLEIERIATDIL